jgi:NAD-dependent dihydropyrimidine dehydrogenase PreA subunit
MTYKINSELCSICSQCIVVCPEDAILGPEKGEFPVIDQAKCTECARCVDYCPTDAVEVE